MSQIVDENKNHEAEKHIHDAHKEEAAIEAFEKTEIVGGTSKIVSKTFKKSVMKEVKFLAETVTQYSDGNTLDGTVLQGW